MGMLRVRTLPARLHRAVPRHACKLGLEGIVSKAPWLALSLRPVEGLAQVQEPGGTSGQARSGRGLDEMTRRKREIIGLRNERDFPHVVELTFPPGGFRSVFLPARIISIGR
jgi:hypothetical protein